jgi:hypothetical protein
MLHLKLLEKQEQAKPKTVRRREIIKIRTKINENGEKKKYTAKSASSQGCRGGSTLHKSINVIQHINRSKE